MGFTRAGFLPPTFGEDETDPGKLAILASEAYNAGRYEACGQLYAQAFEYGARLEAIDESAVTDQERARWGVPPLVA